jgi:hypothetical protein
MKQNISSVKILVGALAITFITGCSVDGNITDETVRKETPRLAGLAGLIPGAQHNVRSTPGGYTVSASVGSPWAAPASIVTSGGYKVHVSVQGNINSATFKKTVQ